jgi:CDP-diacylglycerol--serine O-phosphatidyltransferase
MAEAETQRPQVRRGMYVVPSLFTSGSIALGYYIIMQSIRGSVMSDPTISSTAFDHAALAIAFAIVFDGLDGRIARMTNTSSAFGRELDSLADVITFGVAPSLLAYLWGVRQLTPSLHPEIEARVMHFGVVICFLFLICGACRLARFNISVNPQPRNPGRPGRKYFVGMPIPAGAGVLAAVIHFEGGSPIHNLWLSFVWLAFLEWQGDRCRGAQARSIAGAAGGRDRRDCRVGSDSVAGNCSGVSCLWSGRPARVLVESAHDRSLTSERPIQYRQIDKQ